jgi:hypothetical protein
MIKKLIYTGAALALPLLSFAQGSPGTSGVPITDVQGLGQTILNIINGTLVPVVFAVAFIVFIWGVFRFFIVGAHDEEAKKSGKSLMLYGLIGFFVMVSVWGLVNILKGSFGTTNAEIPAGTGINQVTY